MNLAKRRILNTIGVLVVLVISSTGPLQSGTYSSQASADRAACAYWDSEDDVSLVPRATSRRSAVSRARHQQWVMDRLPRLAPQPVHTLPRRSPASVEPTGCSSIDECVQHTAEAANLPLASLTTDAEFLRRVRLDLTGRIPTSAEVLAFLADPAIDKREQLVDSLLQSSEWADRWAMFFGDLFQNTERSMMFRRYAQGRDAFHLFILESMQQNKSYDQMVREILAAQGATDGRAHPESYEDINLFNRLYRDFESNPIRASPVSYVAGGYTRGGPREDTYDTLASMVARHFLGISTMECILCHDGAGHLDSLSAWGAGALRLEGWNMAAFFARMSGPNKLKRTLRPKKKNGQPFNIQYWIIRDLPEGTQGEDEETGYYRAQSKGGNRPDRTHTERYVAAQYPFETDLVGGNDSLRLREQLGVYLTADLQFARAAVNYIWAEFFSRGIVEPADEFDLDRLRASDALPQGWDVQPSHPHMLELLAEGFKASGFDLKWLMREIVTSKTYQLSSRYEGVYSPNYDQYFVRHSVKPLSAEQIHDAITVATGIPAQYTVSRFLGNVGFAMQFSDVKDMPMIVNELEDSNAVQLLDAFSRGNRDDRPRAHTVNPLQAMNLMNNPLLLDRINPEQPRGTLSTAIGLPDDGLVAQLYLSVLSRLPTQEEQLVAINSLRGGHRTESASRLMWALFNKTDFFFNY